jgi:hypothetical protein
MLGRINKADEMDWKQYAGALLLFNLVCCAALMAMLLTQHLLPLNPQQLPAFPWQLALNTAVSFVTNTNWQNYGGESTASYFTQTVGMTVHNFVSAATGMTVAIVLIRGFVRRKTALLGNFWVDLVRTVLYILLPISCVAALFLASQGVIQNFAAYKTAAPLQADGLAVQIPMGPVASQEAIKELGTNGGGFFNANSAHPFENPTPLTNFAEIFLILLIPASLTYTFGVMAGNTRQGWGLFMAMLLLLTAAFAVLQWAESGGNPAISGLGVQGGNMEGKEVRFGLAGSNLFAVVTTATSCGAVNAMHDSLTPLGGLAPLSLILTGEVVFGGVGSGLYTMLAFAVIAVFVSGLMIGKGKHGVEPGTDAAEHHLARQNQTQRRQPAKGGEGIVHGVDRAAGGGGGDHRKEIAAGQTETDLLAFHVAALDAQPADCRIAAALRPLQDRKGRSEQEQHGHKQPPSLPGVARHHPEGVGQAGGNEQDQKNLREIGKRGRVFKGMRGIGVKKATAVGAQFLDCLLGGDRPHGDLHRQPVGLERRRRFVGGKILDDALGGKEQGGDTGNREKDVENGPDQINPEIAQQRCFPADKTSDQDNGHRHAGGRGDKIVHCHPHRLGEITGG